MRLSRDLQTKLRKFKNDKRAYFSLLILASLFFLALPAELLCNVRPLVLVVDGKFYFPILFTYSEKEFGGTLPREPDYKSEGFRRLLEGPAPSETPVSPEPDEKPEASLPSEDVEDEADSAFELGLRDFEDEAEPGFHLGLEDFEETPAPGPEAIKKEPGDRRFPLSLEDFEEETEGPVGPSVSRSEGDEPRPGPKGRDYWMLWPPVQYDYKYIPSTSETGRVVLAAPYERPNPMAEGTIPPSTRDGHYLGTDDRGRDVLARLIYGFRISMIFGLSLAVTGTFLGCIIGGIQGFFGGWIDLIGQRLTELWGSIPRLYILIILSSFLVPSVLLLFLILNLTAWMGIAAYIRAEFLKIRNFEFVKAAKGMGASNISIMRRHILPNALTPVITFFPFEVTAGILALVSLDYLNLGVPSPAPSMGELLAQGKNNLQAIWILIPTFTLLTFALTLLTFVGEGIRNAFDPRRSG